MRQSEFKACILNLHTLRGIYEPNTSWHQAVGNQGMHPDG